jgi:hypothetical protein
MGLVYCTKHEVLSGSHAMTELKRARVDAKHCRNASARFRLPPLAIALAAVLVGLPSGEWTSCAARAADQPAPAKKEEKTEKAKPPQTPAKKKEDPYAWKSMFDGKTLKRWEVLQFGGDGEVKVDKGAIVLGMGDPMTGIKFTDKLPLEDYEVMLEAKRTEGIDFFATTTFPVGKNCVSLVTGGWAGTVVGISCVDWYDASDNITTQFKSFEDDQWYKIRIRVSQPKIECWIDDEKMVDLARKGHKFDVRLEVDLCKPFGISSYMTEGVVRKLRIRQLKPEEVDKIKKETKEEQF